MSMAGAGDNGSSAPENPPASKRRMFFPSSKAPVPAAAVPFSVSVKTDPAASARQRRPCNCSKSMCLKLYCECFANGEFCVGCKCQNCHNNLEHEVERRDAIQACLDRNPYAFHPKISSGSTGKQERHVKGCHCRRSSCLKNYCECFEAGIPCSQLCKCLQCKNYEDSPDRLALMDYNVDAVANGSTSKSTSSVSSSTSPSPMDVPANPIGGQQPPIITMCLAPQQPSPAYPQFDDNVAMAAAQCLIQRAELVENQTNSTLENLEHAVLEETNLCLQAIAMSRS